MMYASYIVKRTQIYLDEEQAEVLARRARTRRVTTSHVIREAISDYLAKPDDEQDELERFRAAVDEAFGIAPYLPPGDEYLTELRRSDRERDEDLQRRWRG